jgi:hypothetical protein
VAESYFNDREKLLNKIKELYKKAPQYAKVSPLINDIFSLNENNLFTFILNSLKSICTFLEIKTDIISSSSLTINHSLKSQDKVIAICKNVEACDYINPIGGIELYSKKHFVENDIQLNFLKSKKIEYQQFDNEFIPWLSILDVMMFNSRNEIKQMLNQYLLI